MTRISTLLLAVAGVASLAGCTIIFDLDGDDDPPTDAATEAPDGGGGPDGPDPLSSCAVDLPCPAPGSERLSLCGRIHDMESDGVIAATQPTRAPCTATTLDGPCALRLRYFDALDFAMSPGTAMPIVPAESVVDDCGRFGGFDMPRATFGFVAIVVDDAAGSAGGHTITSAVFPNSTPWTTQLRAYATRQSTIATWGLTAGLQGQTFAERGVLVMTFVHAGQPVAGVTARRNGSLIPPDDLYFSDPGVTRTTVDTALGATGANGTVLVTGIGSQTPIAHDGVGAEPSGCVWPASIGAATPGVVSFQQKEAETAEGTACP